MANRSKPVTRKDVIYALQFGGETLIKTLTGMGGQPAIFHLSGTGKRVEPAVAHAALSDPHVHPVGDGLFPGDSQQFEWRAE